MDFARLADPDRQRFEEDGFLVVRDALGRDEVAALIGAGDEVMTRPGAEDRHTQSATYDCQRNVVAHGGPPFERLLAHGRTVALAAQLLSRNLQLHTSQLIYGAPEPSGPSASAVVGWHRDIHSLPADLGEAENRRVEVKIAYILSQGRGRAGGGTLVARGSHRWRARPAFDDHGDPPGVVVPDLAPGDALLFENRTWHTGGRNISDVLRRTAIYGYSFRWMRPDDWVEQPPALLARLPPVARDLVTPMRWRDGAGRFTLAPNIPSLHAWFDGHSAVGAAEALVQAARSG